MSLLFLCSACGMLPLHDPEWEIPRLVEDFEDFDVSEWSSGAQQPDRISWTAQARSGTNALSFTVYPGDYVQGGARAELSWSSVMPYGSEIYVAYSLCLHTNYLDSGRWQIFGQWHDQPDYLKGESWKWFPGNSPPLALHYTNYRLGMSVLYQENDPAVVPLMEYVPGNWVDFTFHIRWSLYQDGFIEGWTNGSQWFERIYAPTLFNRMGNYLKIGLYRSPEARRTNTVYYDEIRVGTSFAEVQP